jgi:hypothetical protein
MLNSEQSNENLITRYVSDFMNKTERKRIRWILNVHLVSPWTSIKLSNTVVAVDKLSTANNKDLLGQDHESVPFNSPPHDIVPQTSA